MLCDRCIDFTAQPIPRGEQHRGIVGGECCENDPQLHKGRVSMQHHGIKQLRLSADNRCHLCHLVFSAMKPGHIRQIEQCSAISDTIGHSSRWSVEGTTKIKVSFSGLITSINLHEPGLNGFQGPQLLHAQCRRVLPEYDSTGSALAMSFLESQLRHCQQNHSLCRDNSTRNRSLPTRLVDLGRWRDGTIATVIQTTKLASSVQFSTLSYCWGGKVPVKLTSRNVHAFESDGIPADSLPKTFRQSFETSVALGIFFIWIDALCIIQDVPSELEKEIQRMDYVFSCAEFNIAASTGRNPTEGLFCDRNPLNAISCHLQFGEYSEKSSPRWCSAYDSTFWTKEVSASPLNSRGWVLQERILSPRVLHFGVTRTIFECRTSYIIEGLGSSLTREIVSSSATPGGNLRSQFNRCLDEKDSMESDKDTDATPSLDLWRNLIQVYTGCRLTVPSDRLSAIAGIAASLLGDTSASHETLSEESLHYVRGVFFRKRNLSGLLWALSDPMHWEKTGPSWSWGSYLDRRVVYPMENFRYDLCKANGPQVIRYDDYSLRILGRLIELRLEPHNDTPAYHDGVTGKIKATGDGLPLFGVISCDDIRIIDLIEKDWALYKSSFPVFFFPCLDGSTIGGLLLIPVFPGPGYRRLGLFFLDAAFKQSYPPAERARRWLKDAIAESHSRQFHLC